MSHGPWTIRAYRPGDERVLTELFARVFKKPISTAHWLWKLRGYELPFENVWLALDGERIIAQYAGIPVRVQTTAGNRWAVLSVDTMVDPDYRRRGVLTQIARHAYAQWGEAGAAFVYGLPNEKAAPGLASLGFNHAFPIRWRRQALRPFAILARRYNIKFPTTSLDGLWRLVSTSRRSRTDIELVEARDADGGFDRIFRRFEPNSHLTLVRDRQWIEWRYFRAPEFGYRLLIARQAQEPLGYVAYRMQNTSGVIAEVFAPSDRVSVALMQGAIEHLRKSGAESVRTLAVPGTPYDLRCRQMLFSPYKNFGLAVLPLATDISTNPNAWRLSGGDFDVV